MRLALVVLLGGLWLVGAALSRGWGRRRGRSRPSGLALGSLLLLAVGAPGCVGFTDDAGDDGACEAGTRTCRRCGLMPFCAFGPEDVYVCKSGRWTRDESCRLGQICLEGECEQSSRTYAGRPPLQSEGGAVQWCAPG